MNINGLTNITAITKEEPNLEKKNINISSVKNKHSINQKQLTNNINSKQNNEHNYYIYNPLADGTCFFRAYLAFQQRDATWLQQRDISDVYNWITQHRSHFIQAMRQSFDFFSNHAEHQLITSTITDILQSPDAVGLDAFFADLLETAMEENSFNLWRPEFIRRFINDYLQLDVSHEFAEQLTDGIYQAMAENLAIPLDTNAPVHLRRISSRGHQSHHYVLVSSQAFFDDVEPNAHLVNGAPRNSGFITEYSYTSSAKDGASFIRCIIANQQNDASWFNIRSLLDVYQWLNERGDILTRAINNAAQRLNLDFFTDAALQVNRLFNSQAFLDAMMQPDRLGFFSPQEVLAFAEAYQINLDPCDAQQFVEHLIEHLAGEWGHISTSPNAASFQLDHHTFLEPINPNDFSAFRLTHQGRALPNAEPNSSRFVPAQAYATYPIPKQEDLRRFCLKESTLGESAMRLWLAIARADTEYLSMPNTVLGANHLTNHPALNVALPHALQQAFLTVAGQNIGEDRSRRLSRFIRQHFFAQGILDFTLILQTLQNAQTSPMPTSLLLGMSNEELITLARQIEQGLITELGYPIYSRADVDAAKVNCTEYFVREKDGSISLVAFGNSFSPFNRAKDPDIYQKDLEQYPERNDPGAYFSSYFGKQAEEGSAAKESKAQKFGFATWQHIWQELIRQEQEAAAASGNTRPHINLEDITRRDALFTRQDAIDASLSALTNFLENFNASADYLGYNTKPYSSRPKDKPKDPHSSSVVAALADPNSVKKTPPLQGTASASQTEMSQRQQNEEKAKQSTAQHSKKSKETTDGKEEKSNWDPLFFPGADAMPVNYPKNQQEYDALRDEYERWHKAHIRNKRRIKEISKATPSDIVELKVQNINRQITAETANSLRDLKLSLAHPVDSWQGKNVKAKTIARYSAIREQMVSSVVNAPNSAQGIHLMDFYLDSLDAHQMRFLEASPDFRTAYTTYMAQNEEAIKTQGKFYFHIEAEAGLTKVRGESPFQTLSTDQIGLNNKKIRLLAEIYHKQSLGQEIDMKRLGMAFANLDIDALSLGSETRMKSWAVTSAEWSKALSSDDAANAKFTRVRNFLESKGLPSKLSSPTSFDQQFFYTKTAGSATSNQGMCDFMARSFLATIKNDGVDGLKKVQAAVESIKQVAVSDPTEYTRILNTLDTVNDAFGRRFFTIGEGEKRTLNDLDEFPPSYTKFVDKLMNSDNGHRIGIRINGLDDGHAISVAKLRIGGQKVSVLIDANYGIVPCYSRAQLETALQKSLSLLPNYDPADTSFSAFRFGMFEMTRENLQITNELKTNTGFSYLDLTEKGVDAFKMPHKLTQNAEWDSLFTNTRTAESTSRIVPELDAYKNKMGIMQMEEVDTRMAQARENHNNKQLQMFGGNFDEVIKAKLSGDALDQFVQAQDRQNNRYTTDPKRSKKLPARPRSEETLTVKANAKVQAAEADDVGAAVFRMLKSDAAEMSLDVNAKGAVEALQTKNVSPPPENGGNILLEKLGLDKSKMAQFSDDANLPAEAVKAFINKELSRVTAESIHMAELENHKILQQQEQLNKDFSELIKAQGKNPEDYVYARNLNSDDTDTIRLQHRVNSEEITISLDKALKARFDNFKASANQRVTAFKAAVTDTLGDDTLRRLKKGWKLYGKGMQLAGKAMSIYSMVSLLQQAEHFSTMKPEAKAALIVNTADVAVDVIANVIGGVNWAVKTFAAPVATLSSISHAASAASIGASLVFNLVELGIHSYSYDYAETDFERKMAGLMVGCTVAKTSLTLVSLAVCSAFPLAAPLFATLGFIISIIQNAEMNKMLAQEAADSSFKRYQTELEKIKELVEDPLKMFEIQKDSLIITSEKVPYLKMEISDSGIKVTLDDKPYANEITREIETQVKAYNYKLFAEQSYYTKESVPVSQSLPYWARWSSSLFDSLQNTFYETKSYGKYSKDVCYDDMPKNLKEYKDILQNLGKTYYGRGFTDGYATPYNFTAAGDSNGDEDLKDEKIKKMAPNGKFDKKIVQEKVKIDSLADCITDKPRSKEVKLPLPKNDKAKHIIIAGHPVKTTYKSEVCTKSTYGGYSYDPDHELVKFQDQCQERDKKTGKKNKGDNAYWKIKRDHIVFNELSEPPQKYKYYQGKKTIIETYPYTSAQRMARVLSLAENNDGAFYRYELAHHTVKCFENPTALGMEFLKPQYVLTSGKKQALIYHFKPDQIMDYIEKGAKSKQKTWYGLHVNGSLPVTEHNIGEESKYYNLALTGRGPIYLYLYPNTYLDLSEKYKNDDSSLVLIIPYDTLEKNQYRSSDNHKFSSVQIEKYNNKKEIHFCPDASDKEQFRVRLSNSASRPIRIESSKEIYDKTSTSVSFLVKENSQSQFGADLLLENISTFPLYSLEHNTRKLIEELAHIQLLMTNVVNNGFKINGFTLSSPYHHAIIAEQFPSKATAEIFDSSGWFLTKDDNIKDHPIVERFGGMIVPKIWRKDTPEHLKQIFSRMHFAGFAKVDEQDLPEDIKALSKDPGPYFKYYFYDQETGALVEQYGMTEIRYKDKGTITYCPENAIPQKVTWGENQLESYSCDAIHIAPQTLTEGVTSNRLHVVMDIGSSLTECQIQHGCDNVFELIQQKVESEIRRQQNTLLTTTESPSATGLLTNTAQVPTTTTESSTAITGTSESPAEEKTPLFMELQGINITNKQNENEELKAILTQSPNEELALSLIPSNEQVIAIPKQQAYALTLANTDLGLTTTPKPKDAITIDQARKFTSASATKNQGLIVNARPVIRGESLEEISEKLIKHNATLSEKDLTEPKQVLAGLNITGIVNKPEEGSFQCQSEDGIVFRLDHDLKTLNLLAVNDNYLAANNATTETAILGSFNELKVRYGSPLTEYFKIQRGNATEPTEPNIFVNQDQQKVVYVPAKDDLGRSLSDSIVVTAEINEGGEKVIVQDPTNGKLVEVENQHTRNATVVNSFDYSYLASGKNGEIYLSVENNNSTALTLPYIKTEHLVLLPTKETPNSTTKALTIPPLMQAKLDAVTLAKPLTADFQAQPININTNSTNATELVRCVKRDYGDFTSLLLLLPTCKQHNGQTIQTAPLVVHLESGLDENGTLAKEFNNTIFLDGEQLDLTQLVQNATVFNMTTILTDDDSNEATNSTTPAPLNLPTSSSTINFG